MPKSVFQIQRFRKRKSSVDRLKDSLRIQKNRVAILEKLVRTLNTQSKITAQGYAASFNNQASPYEKGTKEDTMWMSGYFNGEKQVRRINDLLIAQECLKYIILNYELIDKDREMFMKILNGKFKSINDLYKQLGESIEN